MDNLAAQYRARYQEALNHALEGNQEIALDICWGLRLDPLIGVYRRAMVNLLIAKLVPVDQMKFVEECLDLIDVLKQDNGGTIDDDVKKIQLLAEQLIEELQQKQEMSAHGMIQDPDTGLLTSEPMAPTSSPEVPKATMSRVAGGGDKVDENPIDIGQDDGGKMEETPMDSEHGDDDEVDKSPAGNS